jgi:hypothetical protein
MRRWLIGPSLLLLLAAGCGSKSRSHEDGEDTAGDWVGDDTTGDVTGDGDVADEDVPTSGLVVDVTTPTSPQAGDVTIGYRLIDGRVPASNADVVVEYSVDGGGFAAATEVAGGEGTGDLASAAAPGASHAFVWDTMTDLGVGAFDVVVRITPYDAGTTSTGTADETDVFEVVNATFSAAAVSRMLDPEMPGGPVMDLGYRAEPAGVDFLMTVVVSTPGGTEIRRLVDGESQAGGTDLVASWDGRNASGAVVDTGEYRVSFSAEVPGLAPMSAEDTVRIVRLGVVGVEFLDNGTAGEEYQMMYHVRNSSKYTYYAIPDDRPQWKMGPDTGEISNLDENSGAARALPAVWTNLNSPPQDSTDTAGVEDDTFNLPALYKRGSVPRIRVTLGSSAVSNVSPGTVLDCGYPVTGLPIRILLAGADPETAGTNEDVSPADTVVFVASTALPDTIQKHAVSNVFTFQYQDGGTWVDVPGSITTEHVVYTIHDEPTLAISSPATPPYLAWVKLVDLVTNWVAGPATAEDICATVIERTNTYFGLQYDIVSGACHYAMGPLTAHVMEMSDFIEDWDAHSFTVVNCSDCACISTTLANQVGVDHLYQILGLTDRIPLNYQIPIGRWWMVPFSGSFRYHAVATYDVGLTTSDACCTLDDDTDPGNPPHTAILPVNMTHATYKTKLSWDPSSWGTYTRARCGQH